MLPTGTALTILVLLAPRTFAFQHNHAVGLEGLTFPITTASAGATLLFIFYPGLHNVMQGVFSSPCTPLAGGQLALRARNQRHRARSHDVRSPHHEHRPAVVLLLQDAHCQAGMVGVVNEP
jgi:hypothetical protein